MNRSQRADLVRDACAEVWHGDGSLDVVRDGYTLVFDHQPDYIYGADGQIIGVDAWVRLYGPDGQEVPVDPHRRIVNPPTVHQGETDPAAAFRAAVWDSVRDSPNPDGWRTSGTVTTVFADLADGYISSEDSTYSDARTGSALTAATSNTTRFCGQEHSTFVSLYACYEMFVSFDTAAITDSDVVSAVALDMWLDTDASTTDFTTEARDVDWGSSLTTADWVAGASLGSSTLVASIGSSGIGSTGAYKTFTSETAFLTVANIKTGTVHLLLSSDRQRLGNAPSSNTTEYLIWAMADSSGTSSDPKLTITHASATTTVSPSSVDALASIPTPGMSAGQTVHPSTVDALAVTPSPALSAGATVSPGSVDAAAIIPTPTITVQDVTVVAPTTVTATADIPTPGVSTGQIVAPSSVDAVAIIPTPGISAQFSTTIAPGSVDALAIIPTPSVTVPVLPGSLITKDYQIEYNTSILFGAGVYQILAGSVEGWDDLVELDSGNVLRPGRHGAWPGRKFGQQRYVSAVVLVADETSAFMSQIAALRRATGVSEDETELPLVIRTRGETLLAYGQILGRVMPPDLYHAGFSPVALRWECSDPRRYGLTLHSDVVGTSSAATLANGGDTASSPRIRVFGPAENPVVTNETLNRILAFDLQLEVGERLDIDCAAGTVAIGQVDHMSARSALSVPVEDWVLAAGDNTIAYSVDSAGTGGIEVLHRDAYL